MMRNMTKAKMYRKIWYLRSMSVPNQPGGATKETWSRFFKTLWKLKLTKKLHYYF